MKEQFKEKEITVVNENNNEIKLIVVRPSYRVLQDSQMAYNIKMSSLIKRAADGEDSLLSKVQLEDYLNKIGLWTKNDQLDLVAAQVELRALEDRLKRGGMKLSEGREIAMRMKDLRSRLFSIFNKRSQFDSITMESQAEQAKFICVVVNTVLNADTRKPYFSDVDDYLEREDHLATREIARHVAMLFFGLDDIEINKLPEAQWLRQYKFVDDDGRFINKDGHLIDADGRLIDDTGRFVDGDGNTVDMYGNKVDKYGNLVVDKSDPFIDDDTGEPILME